MFFPFGKKILNSEEVKMVNREMVELSSSSFTSSLDGEVGYQLSERVGESESHSNGDTVASDIEFKPLKHSTEPLDDSEPAKWPLPECSFLGVSGAATLKDQHIWKKPIEESHPRKLKSLLVAQETTNSQLKEEGLWKDWFPWSFKRKSEPLKASEDGSDSDSHSEDIQKNLTSSRTFRKRMEPLVSKDDSPIKASTKRHRRVMPDISVASSSKNHQTNILQVFQQCK